MCLYWLFPRYLLAIIACLSIKFNLGFLFQVLESRGPELAAYRQVFYINSNYKIILWRGHVLVLVIPT